MVAALATVQLIVSVSAQSNLPYYDVEFWLDPLFNRTSSNSFATRFFFSKEITKYLRGNVFCLELRTVDNSTYFSQKQMTTINF